MLVQIPEEENEMWGPKGEALVHRGGTFQSLGWWIRNDLVKGGESAIWRSVSSELLFVPLREFNLDIIVQFFGAWAILPLAFYHHTLLDFPYLQDAPSSFLCWFLSALPSDVGLLSSPCLLHFIYTHFLVDFTQFCEVMHLPDSKDSFICIFSSDLVPEFQICISTHSSIHCLHGHI